KLKKILLDIQMLPYLHTDEEINEQLHSIFTTFNITTKILYATTDGEGVCDSDLAIQEYTSSNKNIDN
ncbi:7514_t:CDS:2, partial [Racocetra persica]